jgi:predicted esterase
MSLAMRARRILWALVIAGLATMLYDWHTAVHPRHSSDQALEGNSPAGETLWVMANGLRLKTRVYGSARAGEHPVLVIVLHGDSPFHPPSYQYIFARKAAEQIDNVIGAAVLRPGYSDDTGDTSDGTRGYTTGDNYTPEVVDAVASLARQLKARYAASHVIFVGHSGGAAIAADVMGLLPGVADGALLVSCPCNVPAFRRHMSEKQMDPLWLAPVSSLSPLDLVGHLSPAIHVRMVVGAKDSVATPELTEEYADALRARHIDVTVTELPGMEHDILLEPPVYEQLRLLVKAVSEPAIH